MATQIIPFAECTNESWNISGGLTIKKRHNKGWPCIGEFFIYSVTGTRDELVRLGICDRVSFPEGRKRVSGGNLDDCDSWNIRAVRGKRWELLLRGKERIGSLERLIELQKLNAMPQRGHLRLVWSAPENAALVR